MPRPDVTSSSRPAAWRLELAVSGGHGSLWFAVRMKLDEQESKIEECSGAFRTW
jgi:hypothetical protein